MRGQAALATAGKMLALRLPRYSARFCFLQNAEQQKPALHVGGHQKIFFDVLASAGADTSSEVRMRQEISNLKCASFHRVHQNTRELVNNLVRYASDRAGNSGLPLPQRLGDRQAKPFSKRLLH